MDTAGDRFETKQKFKGDRAYQREDLITTSVKKPRNRELTIEQKEQDKEFSALLFQILMMCDRLGLEVIGIVVSEGEKRSGMFIFSRAAFVSKGSTI